MWIAVIGQALYDATLGVSHLDGEGGFSKPKNVSSGSIPFNEIPAARRFIKGKDGALENICDAINVDYVQIQKRLIEQYKAAQPYIPPFWRDMDYMPDAPEAV